MFNLLKFRTMHQNAEEILKEELARNPDSKKEWDAYQKLQNDPRITRAGRFLRRFSLDELPQLWNVLRGDMSLVGPRPAIPYEVEMYKPWHLQRLEAQPGLTGLQQVTARCTADFDQQVQLDIEYIKKQSFWLDIKIILQTPIAVISTRGAH